MGFSTLNSNYYAPLSESVYENNYAFDILYNIEILGFFFNPDLNYLNH